MPQPPLDPAYNPSIVVNRSQAEQAIYMELDGDTRFPAVSVTRYQYPDKTEAFPNNVNARPLSSVEVFPKFATLSYVVNPADITGGNFSIPPYKYTALTNDVDGNPTYIEFKDTGPSGTVVAALSCTYVNKFVTSVFQVI